MGLSIRKRKMSDKNVIQGPSPFTTLTNLMSASEKLKKKMKMCQD